MPEHLIRVTQPQFLADSSDVVLQADTPEDAARIVLDAVAGDPDDDSGTRSYGLPDGRKIKFDPEDAVIGGETYAEVVVGGEVVQTIGRATLPIRHLLDLSTAHLQQADRLFLEFVTVRLPHADVDWDNVLMVPTQVGVGQACRMIESIGASTCWLIAAAA